MSLGLDIAHPLRVARDETRHQRVSRRPKAPSGRMLLSGISWKMFPVISTPTSLALGVVSEMPHVVRDESVAKQEQAEREDLVHGTDHR